MSPIPAFARLASTAALLSLAGCYYPYGYYPSGYAGNTVVPAAATQTAVPVNAAGEPLPALNQTQAIPAPPPPAVTQSGSYAVPSAAPLAPAPGPAVTAPVDASVPATAYPPYYPYSGYYPYGYPYPAYWGPSVAVGFGGFWGGGCCWGGWGGGWHGGGWGGGWHGGGRGGWHGHYH